MLQGTALALVLTSLLLIVALRSLRYGLLSMLPNLFPALISFGIWALVDGFIGISVSIVACMTLGIVIDNTVHLLSKYTRARAEQGLNAVAASRYAFKTVGVAGGHHPGDFGQFRHDGVVPLLSQCQHGATDIHHRGSGAGGEFLLLCAGAAVCGSQPQ
ncbi:MAG: hypothetical protein R3F47_08690 [Gammaproteobacteria bacterium]